MTARASATREESPNRCSWYTRLNQATNRCNASWPGTFYGGGSSIGLIRMLRDVPDHGRKLGIWTNPLNLALLIIAQLPAARSASRIPSPTSPSRLSQTRTEHSRRPGPKRPAHRGSEQHNPIDPNLAQQYCPGAQRRTRIDPPTASDEGALTTLLRHACRPKPVTQNRAQRTSAARDERRCRPCMRRGRAKSLTLFGRCRRP
jgi:hypothetical protein